MKEIKPGYFEKLVVNDGYVVNMEYLAIPNNLLNDKTLKANERMVMGAVLSLHENGKDIFGSNKFFSQLINLSESRTSAIIGNLVSKEHLRIHLHRDCYTGRVIRRYLFPGPIYDVEEVVYDTSFYEE
tara:strand:- start:251 stop:634 length:384 start_codon:yes stop_codon:yes gene_type:complete